MLQHGACPLCGCIEEEPFDYDIVGNDVFQCGNCSTVFSQAQGETPVVIERDG